MLPVAVRLVNLGAGICDDATPIPRIARCPGKRELSSSGEGQHLATSLNGSRVVRHSKSGRPTSQLGQEQRINPIRNISAFPLTVDMSAAIDMPHYAPKGGHAPSGASCI